MEYEHLEVYRDASREWRWRLRANGKIIAEGGEGYYRYRGMMDALDVVADTFRRKVPIEIISRRARR